MDILVGFSGKAGSGKSTQRMRVPSAITALRGGILKQKEPTPLPPPFILTIDVEEQFNNPNTALRIEITDVRKRPTACDRHKPEVTEGMIKYALEQALDMLTF